MPQITRDYFEAEKVVFEELQKAGYPKQSIIPEGQIDSRRYVDFLVIDLKTELPMMIIEVKVCSERTRTSVRQLAFRTLKNYYEKCATPVKAIIAVLDKDEKKLELIDCTEAIKEDNIEMIVRNYMLPSYELLTIGARQKSITKKKEKQENNYLTLKWICWLILPLVCVTFVLLDAFDVYPFTTLRLFVIGAGALVTLIPCFKEIKIGEISLKQEIEKQKQENNNA